ncbi:MAG: rhomboid family intramembrane serine protease [Candidatus Nanoarchaeia archaeon]
MKISYSSKVVLLFCLIACIVRFISGFYPSLTLDYFSVSGTMNWTNPLDYVRLFTHCLGHENLSHLFSNLTFILLLGPVLEEKYGSIDLLIMIIFTALITGLINVIFFSNGLYGASGIVFMFIILVSFVGKKDNSIPLEFILVAGIFLGQEITAAIGKDNISQIAHIIGGLSGGFFGYFLTKAKEPKTKITEKQQKPETIIVQ